MSKAWARQRARLFAPDFSIATPPAAQPRTAEPDADFVGRDYARLRSRERRVSRPWLIIALGTLAAALILASLRVSILRLRYDLSAALSEETQLLEQQRTVTVKLRELRDPSRLHELAKELGLGRPERVIQLSIPGAGSDESTP
jgi:hypothetical protein